jgi:hypothetical protein
MKEPVVMRLFLPN